MAQPTPPPPPPPPSNTSLLCSATDVQCHVLCTTCFLCTEVICGVCVCVCVARGLMDGSAAVQITL